MTVRCSQGHDNPDGSLFCDECGEKLDPQSAVSSAASAPAAAPAATAVSAPPAAPATAPKLVVEADGQTFDLAGKSEILIGREDPDQQHLSRC